MDFFFFFSNEGRDELLNQLDVFLCFAFPWTSQKQWAGECDCLLPPDCFLQTYILRGLIVGVLFFHPHKKGALLSQAALPFKIKVWPPK